MAIQPRTVKNKRDASGALTGRSGTVYDVNIKYKSNGKAKTYSRKGFSTKKEAQQHEAEMKIKLTNPAYVPPAASQRKQTVREYMEEWVERHGEANLRPSTIAGYRSNIKNHINACIGDVPLSQLSPAMLDDMYRRLSEKGLSQTSVKYVHRVMSVALDHARKYHLIDNNPARDILTKFGKENDTPEPYSIEQMRSLLASVAGTPWEMIIILGGLYGLRVSEILGLRWRNVDLENGSFAVIEQLPYQLPPGTTEINEMAPVKSGERSLPITDITLPYFRKQRTLQENQKRLMEGDYHDNDLVIAKPNGVPEHRGRISANFGQLLRRLNMPHIRFHDTRHSAATNLHSLTGDYLTIAKILGHSSKGIGVESNLPESVTARYIDVQMDRKRLVLDTYHQAVLG